MPDPTLDLPVECEGCEEEARIQQLKFRLNLHSIWQPVLKTSDNNKEDDYLFDIWPFKSAFLSDKCPYQASEATSLIYRKSTKKLFFDHTWSTILRKNPIIHSKWWLLVQDIINITFIIHIRCKIWIYFEIVGQIMSKTSFLAGFL